MSNPIHFAFCINDNYISYVKVTIKSILENHKRVKVIIHVLSDYFSPNNIGLLREEFSDEKNLNLQLHIVNDSILKELKSTWSIYAWYRLLLPQVLPEDVQRVLYLDADTLVVGDITSLFNIDMAEFSVAGVIDIESFNPETFKRCKYEQDKCYICSGVLLMNLDYWRRNNLAEKIIAWGRENDAIIKFPDQDTINHICQDHKIVLPMRYGILGCYFENEVFYHQPYLEELKECVSSPAIIHYAGQNPWKIELSKHLYQAEWEKFNNMLRHPAKRFYITNGWNFVKMKVWQMLHSKRKSCGLTKEEVISRIHQHDS